MPGKTIYNSLSKHKTTLFLINGLNQTVDDLTLIINKIINSNKHTKIIIPHPKRMDITWPDGEKQYSINSWYNYYSRYDNKFKHDIINKQDFLDSTEQLSNLVNEEINHNPDIDIVLCGISQGGTIAINYSSLSTIKFKSILCIDTIFMHSYIDFKDIKKTPKQNYNILISTKDEIYNPEFQLYCYNLLDNCNNVVNINYRNTYHCENFSYIADFIIFRI